MTALLCSTPEVPAAASEVLINIQHGAFSLQLWALSSEWHVVHGGQEAELPTVWTWPGTPGPRPASWGVGGHAVGEALLALSPSLVPGMADSHVASAPPDPSEHRWGGLCSRGSILPPCHLLLTAGRRGGAGATVANERCPAAWLGSEVSGILLGGM